MFWLKNLRMSGIQLANTRCWETISNCRNRGGGGSVKELEFDSLEKND